MPTSTKAPQTPGPALLVVDGLTFAYSGDAPLFEGWSARLPAGLTWLAGDTGSGKSSLLRLLAGDLRGQGRLVLAGQALADDPAAYRAQVCAIDPRDPAWDAISPAGLMAAHPGADPATWQAHLLGFDLLPHRDKPFYALSTGSRRKAVLAVALASPARLVLLDEPTGGLDAASVRYLAQALAGQAPSASRAVVLASAQGRDAVPGAPAGELLTLPDR